MNEIGRISELWCYPIKSLGGFQLDSVELTPLGIAGDRRFALRNLETGKIVSGKTPRFGRALLRIPTSTDSAGQVSVTIDDRTLKVGDEELDRQLTDLLETPVRVEPASSDDEVYEAYWPQINDMALSDITVDLPTSMMTDKGTFVDLAALHILTSSSLAHLQKLAPQSVIDRRRFRPSMVIETANNDSSFLEDQWADGSGRIGDAQIAFSTPTPRCIMTTLQQDELPGDPQVLQTLARHNRQDHGLGNFACLGIYAEVTEPGKISVGDKLYLQP